MASAQNAVHLPSSGDDDITWGHVHETALLVGLISTLAGQDGPGVLTAWVGVRSNALPWGNMPRHDDRMFRLQHHRAQRVAVGWLHVLA